MKTSLLFLFLLSSAYAFSQSPEYQLKKEQKLAKKSPFEQIIDRELSANIVFEDEEIIAFQPLSSQAPVHFLIVPKKRIPTINDLEENDAELIGRLFLVAKELAKEYGIAETGYRLAFNTNEDSGQSVFHLHLHLLGGHKLGPMVDQNWREEQKKEKD
jgi:histidine triad (HIT) family protein